MATEKTPATALPALGYYTDANGRTWQLSAADAAKLGYTQPDKAPDRKPMKPAGPPDAGPAA